MTAPVPCTLRTRATLPRPGAFPTAPDSLGGPASTRRRPQPPPPPSPAPESLLMPRIFLPPPPIAPLPPRRSPIRLRPRPRALLPGLLTRVTPPLLDPAPCAPPLFPPLAPPPSPLPPPCPFAPLWPPATTVPTALTLVCSCLPLPSTPSPPPRQPPPSLSHVPGRLRHPRVPSTRVRSWSGSSTCSPRIWLARATAQHLHAPSCRGSTAGS